jgi:hypothetical protein
MKKNETEDNLINGGLAALAVLMSAFSSGTLYASTLQFGVVGSPIAGI